MMHMMQASDRIPFLRAMFIRHPPVPEVALGEPGFERFRKHPCHVARAFISSIGRRPTRPIRIDPLSAGDTARMVSVAHRLEHFFDRCIPEPITSSGFFPFGPISTRYCLSSGLLNRNFFSQCEALRYSCEHLGWVYGFSERHKVKSCKAR